VYRTNKNMLCDFIPSTFFIHFRTSPTMPSEQELLDQIQLVAGAINRHKNGPNSTPPGITGIRTVNSSAPTRGRGSSSRRPYQRNFYSHLLTTASRGHPYSRGRGVSRHRTLIVNQQPSGDSDSTDSTPPQWIQKRDRHMQLINASVYEQRAQARQTEIEETKKQRLLDRQTKRDKSERSKLYAFLKRKGNGNQVSVCGNLYRVTEQGNKLEKFQGWFEEGGLQLIVDNPSGFVVPPKRIKVGGVAFSRSKNGNYWRKGAVAASRTKSLLLCSLLPTFRSGEKKDKLCRYFTKSGICKRGSAINIAPWPLLILGSCAKGQACQYVHNPDKLALCPAYLNDHCPLSADECRLSHSPDAHRSPTCVHFNRGHCDKDKDCRYAHIKTNPSTPVCRDFALLGYCELGSECPNRHVFECPDFNEKGECPRKGCKLPHIDTATTVRKRMEGESLRKRYDNDDIDDEDSEDEDSDDDEEEEETDSDVESEGVVDDGERFEDQLDFMHL